MIPAQRRAALRGREGVARWRIETGAWGGRALAAITAAPGLLLMLGPAVPWAFVAGELAVAASLVVGAQEVHRGSRWAAVALLAAFVAAQVGMAAVGAGPPWWEWLVVSGALLFCLVQGVWGTFALARVRREAAASGATIAG